LVAPSGDVYTGKRALVRSPFFFVRDDETEKTRLRSSGGKKNKKTALELRVKKSSSAVALVDLPILSFCLF
jgi:hypothetical protein